MVKRVLMIAYHYPPLRGSSGIQRTLKFSQYLSDFNWEPIVLTAQTQAYSDTSSDLLEKISKQTIVHRAFALDTARHLSFMRRYPGILAQPDRWITWWLGAVPLGLYLIRKYRPEVIWSTYPIATAHLIGLSLHRLTGIPWISDFRDPMVQIGYPSDPLTYKTYQWVEQKAIAHCARAVFTTPGTRQDYQTRFPKVPSSRFRLIENGYDEEDFTQVDRIVAKEVSKNEPFRLLHSGIVYSSERDPIPLFTALSELLQEGIIAADNFRLTLRATCNDAYLIQLIAQYHIDAIVSLEPPVAYQEALSEMLTADGLLILQASNCNNQIPAKLYEYLRANRPILALTDPDGDTAAALTSIGIDTIAPLDSVVLIKRILPRFIALVKSNQAPVALAEKVHSNSRKARTQALAKLLDEVMTEKRMG
ncbi:Glycosyl transferase 4-like domain-containing protein [Nitrosomonas cryotolerans]|uniref:Glycosyl transferase 4-like domain-containing protein n=1 Tax=Nitrosomonas cryotolerans ATCC 49181 TaxID=1131553 RepID=A0A1N6G7Y5_9PROT|nr:glycosyltransferase [Nitrosomonas cryotolerans]SFP51521.1 Glycosyl transferase 4-like domain-containing protein [Nitrosomonas cryotolerans]SIO03571.1 Glycosyl transferase 4-like domain-containing protein [Nitrosomonas cryotolerans ATCC 49181]